MTTLRTEKQPEQGELFEGYRPLITHNRKRNQIPAEIPKGAHHPAQQRKKQPEDPSSGRMNMPRRPLSARKRGPAMRDKAAPLKARVEALIDCFMPIEAIATERIGKWKR
jgi:hypothetical protein